MLNFANNTLYVIHDINNIHTYVCMLESITYTIYKYFS